MPYVEGWRCGQVEEALTSLEKEAEAVYKELQGRGGEDEAAGTRDYM